MQVIYCGFVIVSVGMKLLFQHNTLKAEIQKVAAALTLNLFLNGLQKQAKVTTDCIAFGEI